MAAASAVGRGFTGPARLQGVDLARGLAVIGMLAAHLLTLPEWDWTDPSTWTDIVNGRSSVLFAVLAGVSIALVSGGAGAVATGRARARARAALAARAVLLWLIGLGLIATGVPVYVILPAYAVLFLLAVPVLGLRARTLWALAATLALVMPWFQPALDALPVWHGDSGDVLSDALGWHYPFPVWSAFLVAGMAAGRSGLDRPGVPQLLLGCGGGVAALAYGADAVLAPRLAEAPPYLATVLSARPHGSGLLDVAGAGGFALASLGLCLLLCRVRLVGVLALPVRAVGSMPLTAYAGQILVWAAIASTVPGGVGDLQGMRDLHPFWPFVAGTAVFCTAWALLVGRGPLERIVTAVTRRLVPG